MREDQESVVIGCRKSQLALTQALIVAEELRRICPEYYINMNEIESTGDRRQDIALDKFGTTSIFTKELEMQLINKEIRIAVHSLKDLACAYAPRTVLAAYFRREDPRDCVVLRDDLKGRGISLETMDAGSIIGTSSPRRVALIQRKYPLLKPSNIRGNIQTRLRKLNSGDYSAIILSLAALIRLNSIELADEVMPLDIFPPAPGQGCIVAQCRADDVHILDILRKVSHIETEICCVAERSFISSVMAGCSVPIAAHAIISKQGSIVLSGSILSRSGAIMYRETVTLELVHPLNLSNQEKNTKAASAAGSQLHCKLIRAGAKPLIDTLLSAPNGRASSSCRSR